MIEILLLTVVTLSVGIVLGGLSYLVALVVVNSVFTICHLIPVLIGWMAIRVTLVVVSVMRTGYATIWKVVLMRILVLLYLISPVILAVVASGIELMAVIVISLVGSSYCLSLV